MTMEATAPPKVKPEKKKAPPRAKREGGIGFLAVITESALFKNFILLCIVANAFTLGVDAHLGETNPWHAQIENLDIVFLAIFTFEIVLEFLAQGPKRYFRDGWNWFDIVVVGASYLSISAFSALRTFRVFRVLRLISNVPQVRRVVEALIRAMPGIGAASLVLAIVFYIGAVMATTLYGEKLSEQFGDLSRSGLTLFQLTLFDNWGDTIASVDREYPMGGIFLLVFTILTAFAVLNLFIGVIVDAVQSVRDDEAVKLREGVSEISRDVDEIADVQTEASRELDQLLSEVRALRGELADLRAKAAVFDQSGPSGRTSTA